MGHSEIFGIESLSQLELKLITKYLKAYPIQIFAIQIDSVYPQSLKDDLPIIDPPRKEAHY